MEKELLESLVFRLNHWDDDHEYIVARYGSESGHQIIEVTCKQLLTPVNAALRLLRRIFENTEKWSHEQPTVIQEHLDIVWRVLWSAEVFKVGEPE